MKPIFTKVITIGVSELIGYLREAKPLRTWIRKRRAAKGRDPILDARVADDLANRGLDEAARRAKRVR